MARAKAKSRAKTRAVLLPIGTAVLIPIHSIAIRLLDTGGFSYQGDRPPYSIVTKKGATFVRLEVIDSDSDDRRDQHGKILRGAKTYVTGLSLITLGHIWLEPVLLSEALEVIWTEPRRLALIKDKEIDPAGPNDLTAADVDYSMQLAGFIAAQYPQVLIFHNSGLLFLRSSLAYDYADYYHAEAVVAFYRIVEAVTARRSGIRRPKLKHVLKEVEALGLIQKKSGEGVGWTKDEITDMYILRSGPGAHGAELAAVSRKDAAEVKIFAEMMLIKDYIARRGGRIDVGGPILRWVGRRRK